MIDITLETIRSLVELATEQNLAELTVEQEKQKVIIKTGLASVAHPMPMVMPPQAVSVPMQKPAETPVSPAGGAPSPAENLYKVTSPMVGTFYEAPSPGAPPFASVGTFVAKGQTLCIIEAMKLMNELESEVSGTVRRVLVENGQPVEFGQVLMEVEVEG